MQRERIKDLWNQSVKSADDALYPEIIERFAALIEAETIERCAAACEGLPIPLNILGVHPDYIEGKHMAVSQISAAIRSLK